MILVQYALPTIHQTQRLRMAAEEGHETDLQELLSVPINPDSVATVAQSFECFMLVVVVDDIMVVGFSTRKKGQNFPWNVASAIINSLWILNLIHQPSTFRMKHCRGLKLRVLFFLGLEIAVKPRGSYWDALWGV